jgi:hypothetical protein
MQVHQANVEDALPVTVTSRNLTISVTFYPIVHEHLALLQDGNYTYIVPARNLPGSLIEEEVDERICLWNKHW